MTKRRTRGGRFEIMRTITEEPTRPTVIKRHRSEMLMRGTVAEEGAADKRDPVRHRMDPLDEYIYHEAMCNGDVRLVMNLIRIDGFDPSHSFLGWRTPLHMVLGGQVRPHMPDDSIINFVELLVKAKADVNKCQQSGPPIALAARYPRVKLRASLLRILIENGADASVGWTEGYLPPEGHTVLVYCISDAVGIPGLPADLATARTLLEAKASPVSHDPREPTPIEAARARSCARESGELLALLYEYGERKGQP
jgi:hypothetical protein